jgi:uncharacterized membrane protein YbhN (UPF0104 family)
MSTTVRVLLAFVSTMIAGVALILWLRAFHVTGSEVLSLLSHLNWWTVPIIFVLLSANIALSALRWIRIEVALGGSPQPFSRAFLSGAWALGLGTFLPGPLANVACRAVSNRFSGASGVRGAVSGGLDQMADVAIVALFAIPAAIAFVAHSPILYVVGAPLSALAGWAVAAALSADAPLRITCFLSRRLPKMAPLFTPGLLRKIYVLSLMRLLNLTAITLMIHLASEAATVGATVVSVPLVTLAISAAMLPGSFGVAEWSFTGVLGGFAIPNSEITAFVLANRLILTSLGGLIGLAAALMTIRRLGPASPISPSELQLP